MPPWAGRAAYLRQPVPRTQAPPGECCRFVSNAGSGPPGWSGTGRWGLALVGRDARVDRAGVGVDPTAEVACRGEAGLPEQGECLGRAAAYLAVDDDRLGLGQLAEPVGQLPAPGQLRPWAAVYLP